MVRTFSKAPPKQQGGTMITASDYLFIKACHPQQERVPKWKTRGPNDRSETPSRQSPYCSQRPNYRQAIPRHFLCFVQGLEQSSKTGAVGLYRNGTDLLIVVLLVLPSGRAGGPGRSQAAAVGLVT